LVIGLDLGSKHGENGMEESQDWSSVASGCEAMSFFVFLLYDSKAAVKMVSKFVEEVAVGGIWDIVIAE
jgi:hypothetical protein